ncbi:MAG: hypothetical protein WCX30_01675 [Candidatus Paceibacterota bacterium]|jgi:hypothetical protein|nr:hypothetical protein [bacterium]
MVDKILNNLKSHMWHQELDEVIANPYDYENRKLFIEEASSLLDKIYKLYDDYNLKFHIDDESLNKCIWMLHLDALDTLRDCIFLLKNNKHRITGKMFRDITESLDLSYLIKNNPEEYLKKWFNGGHITHGEYRKIIKKKYGKDTETKEYKNYQLLSGWTHHNYFSLKNSYSLGVGEMLVYDSHCPEALVLPQTMSQYSWEIIYLIKKFIKEMCESGLFRNAKIIESLISISQNEKFDK